MADRESHLHDFIARHPSECDLEDCPILAALLQTLDAPADSDASSESSDSSGPANPVTADSDPDSDSEQVPGARPDVIREPTTPLALLNTFYASLTSPNRFEPASSNLVYFDGTSLLGRHDDVVKTMLRSNNSATDLGELQQNHRILHMGNCINALIKEHGYTLKKLDEEFGIQ